MKRQAACWRKVQIGCMTCCLWDSCQVVSFGRNNGNGRFTLLAFFKQPALRLLGHCLLSPKRDQLPEQRVVKSSYSSDGKDIISQMRQTPQRSCCSNNGSMTRLLLGIPALWPRPPTSQASSRQCLRVPEHYEIHTRYRSDLVRSK